MIKNLPAMHETGVQSLGWEAPLEKKQLPTSEFHGQRNLTGFSPWGQKESYTTDRLTLFLLPLRLSVEELS